MIEKLSPVKQKLVRQAEALASEERRITVELIRCLEAISRQLIYAEMGFDSLHAFCTGHLKLSEGSAHRRIAAMRLSRDVPMVQEKILTGEMNLTNAAKIQTATQAVIKERKESGKILDRMHIREEKTALVESCLNLTQKECDIKLLSELPELKEKTSHSEKLRSLDEEHTELKLVLNRDLKSKIDELQNLLSHINPEKSCLKLLERLVDQELMRLRKRTKVGPAKAPFVQIKYNPTHPAAGRTSYNESGEGFFSRVIPAQLRRLVWTRAQNRCQYPGCKSKYKLQIEHRMPFAKGGLTVAENLELLCRTHNLLRARQEFGAETMEKFARE